MQKLFTKNNKRIDQINRLLNRHLNNKMLFARYMIIGEVVSKSSEEVELYGLNGEQLKHVRFPRAIHQLLEIGDTLELNFNCEDGIFVPRSAMAMFSFRDPISLKVDGSNFLSRSNLLN